MRRFGRWLPVAGFALVFALAAWSFFAQEAARTTVWVAASPKAWVAPTGRRFHVHRDCRWLAASRNVVAMSLQDAERLGLRPCKDCGAVREVLGGE